MPRPKIVPLLIGGADLPWPLNRLVLSVLQAHGTSSDTVLQLADALTELAGLAAFTAATRAALTQAASDLRDRAPGYA